LEQELKAPKHLVYNLCFTEKIEEGDLQRLAAADVQHVVKEVMILPLAFLPVDRQLFDLNVKTWIGPGKTQLRLSALDKCLGGIKGACDVLGLKPAIRYASNSPQCKDLATSLASLYSDSGRVDSSHLLLILDRRDDAYTPLLTQYTYRAMVHEIVGINFNRVQLEDGPTAFSAPHDDFIQKEKNTFYDDVRGVCG